MVSLLPFFSERDGGRGTSEIRTTPSKNANSLKICSSSIRGPVCCVFLLGGCGGEGCNGGVEMVDPG